MSEERGRGPESAAPVSGPEDERLEAIADAYMDRLRRGESPSVEEYAKAHPDIADRIREVLPTLRFMERAGGKDGCGSEGAKPEASHPQPAAIPDRIGEYRIVRELGRGGMGLVFEAVQESLGRRVALKLLPSWARLDPRRLERFRQETRAAAALQHPNIVAIYGVGEEGGIPYYAMQYIEGEGLDRVLVELRRLRGMEEARGSGAGGEASPLSCMLASDLLTSERGEIERAPAQGGEAAPIPSAPSIGQSISSMRSPLRYFSNAIRIVLQAADALQYAHDQGVLHRDIKPSNLLVDRSGRVWIADFGLAKTKGGDDLTQSGEIIGTPRYMAPERLRGWSDPRSDIYGLGLTLYEMLTLRPAFEDTDSSELFRKIAEAEPGRPRRLDPRIPRDLETIVLKAIAHEPAERYQTAGDLAEDLRRFQRGEPVLARPTSAWRRSVKWARRRPAVAALVAVVILSLSAVTALTLVHSARVREESDRARANLLDAIEAVKKMLVQVSSDDMTWFPRAEPFRRNLLEEAMTFHRRFLERSPDDPKIALEAARVQCKVAEIQLQAGHLVEAEETWGRAIDFLTPLERRTSDPEARKELDSIRSQLRLLEKAGMPPSVSPVTRIAAGKGANVVDVAAADVDGDGRLEILSANRDLWSVSVFRARRPREFVLAAGFPLRIEPYGMVVGQLDGRSGPDVAAFSISGRSVAVLLNQGDGTFGPSTLYTLGFIPRSSAAADLDGDGREEVAFLGNYLQILDLGPDGQGTLGESIRIHPNAGSIVSADFDGDGCMDLVAGCHPDLKGRLWMRWGDGKGGVAEVTELALPVMPLHTKVADLDADGDLDIVVEESGPSRVAVAWNEGKRRFRAGEPFILPKSYVPFAVGDLDGDGDTDVAFSQEIESLVSFLLNDREGMLSAGRPVLTGGEAFRGAAADLDGDGELDLLVANGHTDDVAVMFNLRKHLGARTGDGAKPEKAGR